MDDTSVDVIKKMAEMVQQRPPAERMKMGSSMFDTSKQLIIRSILNDNPSISPSELRKEVFLKFYGNDFPPAIRAKVLKYLESDQF